MESDRYKRGSNKLPKKRSINSDDSPSSLRPKIINTQPISSTELNVSAPKKNTLKLSLFASKKPKPVNEQSKPTKDILDVSKAINEDDIFGVWKKQKEIKKAQQLEEARLKVAKRAAKQLKKEQKLAQKKANISVDGPTEISISLTVPKVTKPKIPNKIRGYNPIYKKYYIAGGLLLALPACMVLAATISHSSNNKPSAIKPEVQGQTVAAKPDFNTLKPTTKENQATQIKYDTKKKVASYNDVLKNVPITVSQQPLPTNFSKDPTGEVASLAKQINANDKISTSDATAYSGISIKGPETVVFTKNDLLIFIIADKKIDSLAWADYIEKMQ